MGLTGTARVHQILLQLDRTATETSGMLKLAYQEETTSRTGAHDQSSQVQKLSDVS